MTFRHQVCAGLLVPGTLVLAGCSLLPTGPTGPTPGPAPTASTPDRPVEPTPSVVLPVPRPPASSSPGRPSTSPTPPAKTPKPGAPRTYADARDRINAAPGRTRSLRSFTTPSGNIFCGLTDDQPGCELGSGRIEPPRDYCGPAGGGAQDIGRVVFIRGRPKPICNSDTIVTPGARTLPYGSVAEGPAGVRCLSESVGVTCIDPDSRRGFFLSKDRYGLF